MKICFPNNYILSSINEEYFDNRDGETPAAAGPRAASPAANNHPISSPQPGSTQNHPSQPPNVHDTSVSPANQEVQATDEFDPRGAVSGRKAYVFTWAINIMLFVNFKNLARHITQGMLKIIV